MRLSQLARKLEISPTELISFFNKSKIGKYDSHNNKVEESDLKIALNHFNPADKDTEVVKNPLLETESTIDIREETEEDNKPPSGSDSNISLEEAAQYESPVDEEDEIELIRMPKIKLEGVKVVGKIDLPEPPKKVIEEKELKEGDQSTSSDGISSGGQSRKDKNFKKRAYRQKGKNKHVGRELSYEEKLKREESRKNREQQRAKRLKKEQKKLHYIKNVQSNFSSNKKKKKSKKTEELELEPVKTRPEYRNPVRKFWAWLNGEYD